MPIDMTKLVNLEDQKAGLDVEHASIATVESTSTASKAYKVGERFWFKGKLCICTVDIASGGTITLNTNCKLDVLGDDLTSQSEKIDELKSSFDTEASMLNTIRTIYTGPWVQGRLSETTGANASSDSRCRSTSYFNFGDLANSIHCVVQSGYKWAYFEYTSNGTFTSRFGWISLATEYDLPVNPSYKYRFLIAKSDNSNIAPQNVPDQVLAISYPVSNVNSNITDLQNISNLQKYYKLPWNCSGNKYINHASGAANSSTTSCCTDYLDVSNYGRLYYSRQWMGTSSTSGGLAFYDENKTYISGRASAKNASTGAYNSVLETIDVPTNAKYVRFTLYVSSSAGTFNAWGVPRILLELEDAKNGITTKRNSKTLVTDFLTVAQSYLSQELTYGQTGTILDISTETTQIDCSAFVGLVLRGYSYSETSYATSDWVSPDSWVANLSEHDWAINPYDYTEPYNADFPDSPATSNGVVRTASQLAQWMVERGCTVPMDEHLANIEPGDIVFFARQDSSTDKYVKEERYMKISHVAICLSKETAPDSASWDSEKYPYKHTIIDARTRTGSVGTAVLEVDQDDPTKVYDNNINTLCLVCRPDLGSL